MTIHLGISPCPNDTFTFHGLLADKIDRRGLDFRIELRDVQDLNDRLRAGEFDVAKASFHAALRLASEIVVLPTGSALGFGVGPLLLAARPGARPAGGDRVLCPGEATTATLLYRLFHPGEGRVEQVIFSDIMPALEAGTEDFGVCIHEGRFTYRERGLHLVEDLGAVWETATASPLPLGGIVARRRLGADTLATIQAVIADSLAYGHAHRAETLATMRAYAQELDDAVILAHVDLYVNQWTTDLGDLGRRALTELSARAVAAGVIPAGAARLEILGRVNPPGPTR